MPEGITRQGSVSPRRSSTHTEQNEQKTNEAKNNYSLFEECYEKVFPGIDKFLKPDDRGNLRSTSNTIHKIPADKKLSLNITIKSEEAYRGLPGQKPPFVKYIERRLAQQDIKEIRIKVGNSSGIFSLPTRIEKFLLGRPDINFIIDLSEVSQGKSDGFVGTLRILTGKEASEWENLTIIPCNELPFFEPINYDETNYSNWISSANSLGTALSSVSCALNNDGTPHISSVLPRTSTHTKQNEQKTSEAKNNYSPFENIYGKIFPEIRKFLSHKDYSSLRSTSSKMEVVPATEQSILEVTIKSDEVYRRNTEKESQLVNYVGRKITQQNIKEIRIKVENNDGMVFLPTHIEELLLACPYIQFVINLSGLSREISDGFVETLRALTGKEASEWENLTIIPGNQPRHMTHGTK